MRLTIPAAHCSCVAGAWLIRVRLGAHSVDTDWPWWHPWDALADPLGDERDGAHPSRTCEAFVRLGADTAAVPELPGDIGGEDELDRR